MSTDTTTAPELILADDQDSRFRFRVGHYAYVRGWIGAEPVKITRRLLHLSTVGIFAPHYNAVDDTGKEWLLSQLELSTKSMEKLGR